MSTDRDTERAARQVLNNKIKTDRFWRDYSTLDAGAVFGPSVVLITIGRLVDYLAMEGYPVASDLSQGLAAYGLDIMTPAYVVAVLTFILWGSVIYVLPSWETPSDFVAYTWDGIMTPDTYDHVEHNYDSVREQTHESSAKWWHTETRTQDLHRVDEFPLGADVVRRRDGQLVGAIKVSSSNMTLAGRDKWSQNVNKFEDYLENSLDFDFSIHSPTRRFKKGRYVNRQRDRLTDEDVRTNPVLEAMCADYSDWLDVKLGGSSTATRETYVIVPVDSYEVRYVEEEETIKKNLANLFLFGRIFRKYIDDGTVSESVLYERQLEEVNRRLKSLQQDCIGDLSGCSSERVTGGSLAELIYSHWEGEEFEGDMDDLLRQYPIVTTQDLQDTHAENRTPTNTATGN